MMAQLARMQTYPSPLDLFKILKDSQTVLMWKAFRNEPNVHWRITFAPSTLTSQRVLANSCSDYPR